MISMPPHGCKEVGILKVERREIGKLKVSLEILVYFKFN
ncbi:MAG: hypothetical protein RI894_1808 [Bacteroidota bacterium]